MDDLLPEFIAECHEGLGKIDNDLVAFERDPGDRERLGEIFRVIHTIKGTCGFLGLSRLERVSHAAETLLGAWRDGDLRPTGEAMTTVLRAIDRIKDIVGDLEATGSEPEGDDSELIAALEAHCRGDAAGAPETPAVRATAGPGEVREDPAEETGASADDPGSAAAAEEDVPVDASAPAQQEQHRPAAAQDAASPAGESGKSGGRKAAAKVASLRVSVALLESLMGYVSDLVLTRNRLVRLGKELGHPELDTAVQRLDQITTELRDGVMKARMQPISNAWSGVPRIVRDLSTSLGKKIDLVMEGGSTELDRQMLEQVKDPLTHIVRNAIDHGIETPEERRRAGKPETGRLRLSAAHEGGMIVVRIADDGRGLDLERIGRKAVKSGLCTEADLARMSQRQIASFIFAAGLSTAEKVTNISGRGVGMDVVRSNIEEIGGSVEIETWPGKGTLFTITIPLTLAIVPALIVGVDERRFALPQQGIVEIVRCGEEDRRLEAVDGRRILKLRGELLPVVSLAEILGLGDGERTTRRTAEFVLVLEPAGQRFGVAVDAVHDSEEIVVEPIAPVLKSITLFAGTTLLGDGSIALVLDLKALAAGLSGENDVALDEERVKESVGKISDATRLLRFRAGRYHTAAVPVELVHRIERIGPDQVELLGSRSAFRVGDELVPLVDIDAAFIAGLDQPKPALLFADGGRRFGLVVDEIRDVVEAEVELTVEADGPTTLGAGVVDGTSCVLLDVGYFVNTIFGGWFDREGGRPARGAARRARILFVDDSVFFRGLLTPILQNRGFEVEAVDSAAAAIELLESGERFDAVISDIEMPGMDGFAFAEHCRNAGWTDVPIIALSSRAAPEDRARGSRAGFDDHVAKLDRNHLFEALSRLIGTRVANA